MEHDIRNVFRDDETHQKELPEFHREEFLEKLKEANKPNHKKKRYSFFYKVAASIVLLLSVSYLAYHQIVGEDVIQSEETASEIRIIEVEQEYLQQINDEWGRFVKLTNDQKLIKRYEEKLASLDADYKELSDSFKKDRNNILLVEALVDNLKTRLELLKGIQEHIYQLNQQNRPDENTVI